MSSSGYRALFRQPAVRWQAGTGLAAQVIQGAASAGIILVVHQYGGSLTLAGAVLAGFWVAGGIARPIQGRLIDRRGAAGLLAASGLVNGACVAGIVGLAAAHAPGVALVALAVLGGLSLPPVSTSMRIVWAKLAGDDERTAAYSLVYLIQELSVLSGPLILALLVAVSTPSAGLLVVVGVATLGTLGFAASISGAGAAGAGAAGAAAALARQAPLRIANMRVLLLVAMLIGALVGALQVAAPVFATAHHSPAAAGLLIAAISIGGIVGAATYAAGRWRAPAAVRLVALLVGLTVIVAVATLARSLVALGALLLICGLPLNPSFTTLSLLVDQHVPSAAAGEAFGWLSTGIATGTGAGSAIAAALAEHHHDARTALIVAVVAGIAASAAACAAVGSLRGASGARPRRLANRRADRSR